MDECDDNDDGDDAHDDDNDDAVDNDDVDNSPGLWPMACQIPNIDLDEIMLLSPIGRVIVVVPKEPSREELLGPKGGGRPFSFI